MAYLTIEDLTNFRRLGVKLDWLLDRWETHTRRNTWRQEVFEKSILMAEELQRQKRRSTAIISGLGQFYFVTVLVWIVAAIYGVKALSPQDSDTVMTVVVAPTFVAFIVAYVNTKGYSLRKKVLSALVGDLNELCRMVDRSVVALSQLDEAEIRQLVLECLLSVVKDIRLLPNNVLNADQKKVLETMLRQRYDSAAKFGLIEGEYKPLFDLADEQLAKADAA